MDFAKNILNITKKEFLLTDKAIIDTFRDYWDGLTKVSGTTAWVDACANTWGNFYASANFRLYTTGTGGDLKEVYDHPFLDILSAPNDFQTWWELKYFMASFQSFFGNYYLLKIRNVMGIWKQTQMLDPGAIKPITTRSSFIDHYDYNINGKTIRLDKTDVIHIRYPYAGSQIKGAPLISVLGDQIDIDKYQTRLQKRFYANGGFWGQMFSTSQTLTPNSYNKAKAELEQRAGIEGSYKFGLFDGGLQPIKAGYSIKDMEISEQRKLTREEILGAFRIPQILIGGGSDTYNRATAEAAWYLYASSFIDPGLNYVDEVFTGHIKYEYGKKFLLKHDKMSPKDVENALRYYESMTKNGLMTINEVRQEEDYDKFKYELADVPIVNVGGALVRIDTGQQLGQVPNNAGK